MLSWHVISQESTNNCIFVLVSALEVPCAVGYFKLCWMCCLFLPSKTCLQTHSHAFSHPAAWLSSLPCADTCSEEGTQHTAMHPPDLQMLAQAYAWLAESMGGRGGRRSSVCLHIEHRWAAVGCLSCPRRQCLSLAGGCSDTITPVSHLTPPRCTSVHLAAQLAAPC